VRDKRLDVSVLLVAKLEQHRATG